MGMQSADLRNLYPFAKFCILNRPSFRRILIERQVGAIFMRIIKISCQDFSRMRFSENNYVIQAIATYGADEAFAERIVPRAPGRCHDFLDANRLNPISKFLSINIISIAQQILWFRPIGKRLNHLLPSPARCRMLRHIRSWARTPRTNRTRKLAVGTTKKSMETKSLT